MREDLSTSATRDGVVVIGAGIGGLAAALRLAHAGLRVTVLEALEAPGGKIRTVPTPAGPSDAGPTVLTMRHVFDQLFADVGERLSDHVTLEALPVLARHFWSDGTRFDLCADDAATRQQAAEIFGPDAARQIAAHRDRAARLFAAFDEPMMQTAGPSPLSLAARVMRQPQLVADMAPHRTMARQLDRQFDDPRLAQLYGRYATYVGGSPAHCAALLDLVSHAEAAGVWRVAEGMHALPRAIARLAEARGAQIHYATPARALQRDGSDWIVSIPGGQIRAPRVVFNGDPRALREGHLGPAVTRAVPPSATAPRSLSAVVLSFAARASGPRLSHHNVFFSDTPAAEFAPIRAGRLPTDATLYLCAQDSGTDGMGRFEIILNAPAGLTLSTKDQSTCLTRILTRLARFGVTFDPAPTLAAMTTPAGFDALFPASQGALYGRSPEGLTAAFKRPTARTRMPGLYLAGGGAHPGAGVPMATLSGRHAAAAILQDRASTSKSDRTATRGGMSTGSATTAAAPSRSSAS